jgi:catechol 2,3-dioxygenase-like lactoylglutathione lyase family enzyme
MGRLDHVHIRVPDRAAAARWYQEHLGFEPVAAYDFLASRPTAARRPSPCSRPARPACGRTWWRRTEWGEGALAVGVGWGDVPAEGLALVAGAAEALGGGEAGDPRGGPVLEVVVFGTDAGDLAGLPVDRMATEQGGVAVSSSWAAS